MLLWLTRIRKVMLSSLSRYLYKLLPQLSWDLEVFIGFSKGISRSPSGPCTLTCPSTISALKHKASPQLLCHIQLSSYRRCCL